jgi:homocysteine S-methyltransferase
METDHSHTQNPFDTFLQRQNVVVLDGGLATELEARGHDLNDALWSARLLLENPAVIRDVHLDYLRAGADCITSASYQASFPGFRRRGLNEEEAADLLRRSVDLAIAARDEFWSENKNRQGRMRPLVAASIGPYGAFLADGSEYTGDYADSPTAGSAAIRRGDVDLRAFHKDRWRILADSPADLLACESIPSRREVAVVLELLRATPGAWAWMSVTCRSGTELSDGSRIVDVARDCDAEPRVAAVGINCTSPRFISQLITEVRNGTDKPVIVYPNSGERYDADQKTWEGEPLTVDGRDGATAWVRLGAAVIGGCCRVGPKEIAELRPHVVSARE